MQLMDCAVQRKANGSRIFDSTPSVNVSSIALLLDKIRTVSYGYIGRYGAISKHCKHLKLPTEKFGISPTSHQSHHTWCQSTPQEAAEDEA
jgi:sterol desaturase/sphingolipid hydroxylase (fatty acid hydroxylase superfamily)